MMRFSKGAARGEGAFAVLSAYLILAYVVVVAIFVVFIYQWTATASVVGDGAVLSARAAAAQTVTTPSGRLGMVCSDAKQAAVDAYVTHRAVENIVPRLDEQTWQVRVECEEDTKFTDYVPAYYYCPGDADPEQTTGGRWVCEGTITTPAYYTCPADYPYNKNNGFCGKNASRVVYSCTIGALVGTECVTTVTTAEQGLKHICNPGDVEPGWYLRTVDRYLGGIRGDQRVNVDPNQGTGLSWCWEPAPYTTTQPRCASGEVYNNQCVSYTTPTSSTTYSCPNGGSYSQGRSLCVKTSVIGPYNKTPPTCSSVLGADWNGTGRYVSGGKEYRNCEKTYAPTSTTTKTCSSGTLANNQCRIVLPYVPQTYNVYRSLGAAPLQYRDVTTESRTAATSSTQGYEQVDQVGRYFPEVTTATTVDADSIPAETRTYYQDVLIVVEDTYDGLFGDLNWGITRYGSVSLDS